MNPTLAAMYNTNGFAATVHKEQVKVAHLELFAKAAAAQGIDLSALDQSTAQALYSEFTQKVAEEGGEVPEDETPEHESNESPEEEKKEKSEGDDDKGDGGEGPEEEKKEAQAQFRAMQEWQQKVAEADYLGRVMAHSFHSENAQIKQASAGAPKTAPSAPAKVASAPTAATKEASAFDVQAARHALKVVGEAGMNTKEAASRLNAVLTLGVPELNKTASAMGDYNQALNVRALELLEAGGYPVNWSQVLGG